MVVRCSQVWGTGRNFFGQLGLGDTTDRHSPTLLPSPTRVVQVAAGDFHTMLLDEDGRVRLRTCCVARAVRELEALIAETKCAGF